MGSWLRRSLSRPRLVADEGRKHEWRGILLEWSGSFGISGVLIPNSLESPQVPFLRRASLKQVPCSSGFFAFHTPERRCVVPAFAVCNRWDSLSG